MLGNPLRNLGFRSIIRHVHEVSAKTTQMLYYAWGPPKKEIQTIVIFHQFSTMEPHFVRKGRSSRLKITIFPQFSTIEPHFMHKGRSSRLKIAIGLSF